MTSQILHIDLLYDDSQRTLQAMWKAVEITAHQYLRSTCSTQTRTNHIIPWHLVPPSASLFSASSCSWSCRSTRRHSSASGSWTLAGARWQADVHSIWVHSTRAAVSTSCSLATTSISASRGPSSTTPARPSIAH